MKKRTLSGMRPSGKLHIGHWQGVLVNWLNLQESYDCFFFAADWHTLTTEYEETSKIKDYIYEMILDWLSVGIDPNKSTIFIQSQVKQHAELFLLLSMITPLGWLERCPTYKEKLQEENHKDISTHGFLGYPVLQAADILIYKANAVPVGADQLPHLELTREIVRRFHNIYRTNIFPEPESLLSKSPKLLGTDGRKMSKTYDNSIYLSDSEKEIQNKISKMITDPERIHANDKGHPEICSIFNMHCLFNKDEATSIKEQCQKADIGCVSCKKNISFKLNNLLNPIREKRKELEKNPSYIWDIVNTGNIKARAIAEQTLDEVRKAMKINYKNEG